MAAKIRKGDLVEVIAGRHKGERGRVVRVQPDKDRVWVEKINVVKRHRRGIPGQRESEILEKEAPIHASNVMIVDPKENKPTRVGFKFVFEISEEERQRLESAGQKAQPKKVRYAKLSGTTLD